MNVGGSVRALFSPGSARLLCGVALAGAGVLASGCGGRCDRHLDEKPVPFAEGHTNLAAGFYESAPPEGPYLDFPAGRTYRFMHGLGAVPRTLNAYLSFDEHPGEFAEAAGNQVTYAPPTSEYVDVRNDTCSPIYIRITLSNPILISGDAGTD